MNHQPDPPTPDAGAINERVKTAVQSHRFKLRVLTTVAFVFGFVRIAASLLVVWSYLLLYLPKQGEVLSNSERILSQPKTNAVSVGDRVKRLDEFVFTELFLTRVVSQGWRSWPWPQARWGWGRSFN